MNKFIIAYRRMVNLNSFGLGDYKLCWITEINKWSVIDITDYDLSKMDKNKI